MSRGPLLFILLCKSVFRCYMFFLVVKLYIETSFSLLKIIFMDSIVISEASNNLPRTCDDDACSSGEFS